MVVITQQEAAERLSPAFEGRKGKWLFRLAAGMTGIAKVNALHDRVDTAGVPYGPAFAKALLDDGWIPCPKARSSSSPTTSMAISTASACWTSSAGSGQKRR